MASSPLAPGLENAWDAQVQLPTGVHVWMSTRQGGVSRAPWDSLNLGEHVGDAPEAVAGNRARLQQALGARPVFLRQVHGTDVLELGPETVAGQADACFTFATGVACTIQVADCLPVLLWDRQGQWVAAAHAGWRGLAGKGGCGVLEALWQALAARGAQAAQTSAWLGPCIGPGAFEVGPEVKAAFCLAPPSVPASAEPRTILAATQATTQAATQAAFVPGRGDRWWADLPQLARLRLRALGVRDVTGNDGSAPWCTVSGVGRFFSHRRDAARLGSSGRMAACIWRD